MDHSEKVKYVKTLRRAIADENSRRNLTYSYLEYYDLSTDDDYVTLCVNVVKNRQSRKFGDKLADGNISGATRPTTPIRVGVAPNANSSVQGYRSGGEWCDKCGDAFPPLGVRFEAAPRRRDSPLEELAKSKTISSAYRRQSTPAEITILDKSLELSRRTAENADEPRHGPGPEPVYECITYDEFDIVKHSDCYRKNITPPPLPPKLHRRSGKGDIHRQPRTFEANNNATSGVELKQFFIATNKPRVPSVELWANRIQMGVAAKKAWEERYVVKSGHEGRVY